MTTEITPAPKTIIWKKTFRRGKWYESTDGRFEIMFNGSAPVARRWTLIDKQNQDPVVPEFKHTARVATLKAAKSRAERWVRGVM